MRVETTMLSPDTAQYAGTGGKGMSVAAIAGDSQQHCRCLYDLLRPYANYYAIGISFHCQGSLAHSLGNLARALGDAPAALTYLCHGVEQNRALGLLPCMLHNQLDLAKLLLARGPVQDVARARALLGACAQHAVELGMLPLRDAAESLFTSAQGRPSAQAATE